MKEAKGKDEASFICTICHKTKFKINQNHIKLKNLFNENLKDTELSDLIIKCNCNNSKYNNSKYNGNNKSEKYTHKYCIIVKILFNFELKCEKCNTIYNIKIDKKKDKKKIIFYFIIFLIIYILHIFIYIFSIFLIFINDILKGKFNILYRHLTIFFAIIILTVNSIFLFISIKQNINKCKYKTYKYSINIFDINYICNNNNFKDKEKEFYYLLYQFYQNFYNQSIFYLLPNINKQLIINKINYLYRNSINNLIKNNNIDVILVNRSVNIIPNVNNKQMLNGNIIENSKEVILNNNNKNLNFRKLSPISFQNENNIYYSQSNINKNIFNFNTSLRDEKLKLSHKDFINININPVASKNININIHLYGDNFKEDSSTKLYKVGKTALIPKIPSISNIILDNNPFIRKKRLLKSNKIKENRLNFKNMDLSGNIEEDEEVDFSEFNKMDSKIFKENKDNDNKHYTSKNILDSKSNYFRGKISYKDVELNISNSAGMADENIYK